MSDPTSKTTVIWPPLIRRCVTDLAKIVEAHQPPKVFDLITARLQTLLDDHASETKR